jgi:tRNA(Ile)-lysidine synthase TilS/MesJ
MIKKKTHIINLLNKINTILQKNTLIKPNDHILISISGGQDSICVFFIFLHLKRQWKWSFGVIYNNHLWQKNAFFTNDLVIELAYIFQIPIYCIVAPNKIFNENKSRYWRYNTFYRISFFYNYKLISTGHTSSDKIENILFQLTRGTSGKSLTSLNLNKYFLFTGNFSKNMKNRSKYLYYFRFNKFNHNLVLNQIKPTKLFYKNYLFKTFPSKFNTSSLSFLPRILIRPVLNLHRFDLQKLANFWKLPIYPDKSNKKTDYYRNRIRKQLLPTLKFFFNPKIDLILLQFSEILAIEQLHLEVVSNRLKYDFYLKKKFIFKLNISLFYNIPLAVKRKLLKKFLENFSFKQISFFQINHLLNFLTNKKIYSLNKLNKLSRNSNTEFQFSSNIKCSNNKKNSIKTKKTNFNKSVQSQLYWVDILNKKKSTILNVYLINIFSYIYFIDEKILISNYKNFFKKNFFLLSINKFFIKFNSFMIFPCFVIKTSFLLQGEKKIHFSLYNIIYFLNQQIPLGLKKRSFFLGSKKTSFACFPRFSEPSLLRNNKNIIKKKIERKNTFSFQNLTKKKNFLKNKEKYRILNLNSNQITKTTILYYEGLSFSSCNCYFQKFKIIFYPELGILFYFEKKIFIFKKFHF